MATAELRAKLAAPPYDGSCKPMDSTKRKIFWIVLTVLSLLGYFLPMGWALAEMFAAIFASWWLVYRSGLL
jgi:hypothetical protein